MVTCTLASLTVNHFTDNNVGESMDLSELRTIKRCQKFMWPVTLGNKGLRQFHCGQTWNVTEWQREKMIMYIFHFTLCSAVDGNLFQAVQMKITLLCLTRSVLFWHAAIPVLQNGKLRSSAHSAVGSGIWFWMSSLCPLHHHIQAEKRKVYKDNQAPVCKFWCRVAKKLIRWNLKILRVDI